MQKILLLFLTLLLFSPFLLAQENALALETSPYLQQHKTNPVSTYPKVNPKSAEEK